MSTSPISIHTLPALSEIGPAETVADALTEILVGVPGAVERLTADVVPESCRRPRKVATPEDAVMLVVVAGDDMELLVLVVRVGLAVEVGVFATEDWRHVVNIESGGKGGRADVCIEGIDWACAWERDGNNNADIADFDVGKSRRMSAERRGRQK